MMKQKSDVERANNFLMNVEYKYFSHFYYKLGTFSLKINPQVITARCFVTQVIDLDVSNIRKYQKHDANTWN